MTISVKVYLSLPCSYLLISAYRHVTRRLWQQENRICVPETQQRMKALGIRYLLVLNMGLNTLPIWNCSKHCSCLDKLPQHRRKCGWWSIREGRAYFCTSVITQCRKLLAEELHGLCFETCVGMGMGGLWRKMQRTLKLENLVGRYRP